MKRKLYILSLLLCILSNIKSQDSIIFQNEEHVIYYQINNDIVDFYIEDLKDNENNFDHKNGEYPVFGSGNLCNNGKVEKLTDIAYIEFDVNQNGKVDNDFDIGYCLPIKGKENFYKVNNVPYVTKETHSTSVFPHYIVKSNMTKVTYERGIYTRNYNSRADGEVNWLDTKYSDRSHPVWHYIIPLSEFVDKNNYKCKVRFLVLRVSSYWGNNQYGTFYYPSNNDCSGENFFSFTLDFSKTSYAQKVKTIKKDYENKVALRRQNTVAAATKATTQIPEWDGAYIKLSNGKYIEMKPSPLNLAGYIVASSMGNKSGIFNYDQFKEIVSNAKWYQLKEDIETRQSVYRFKKSEFKEIVLVASNIDANKLSSVSLSKYNLVQLKEDGSEMLFPLLDNDNSTTENIIGNNITRTTVYLLNEKLVARRQSLPNNCFSYSSQAPLKGGLYSFYLEGKQSFFFELIE